MIGHSGHIDTTPVEFGERRLVLRLRWTIDEHHPKSDQHEPGRRAAKSDRISNGRLRIVPGSSALAMIMIHSA